MRVKNKIFPGQIGGSLIKFKYIFLHVFWKINNYIKMKLEEFDLFVSLLNVFDVALFEHKYQNYLNIL